MKVNVPEASIFVDADRSVVKCLVLSRQGDVCRIEAQVQIPVHSICCNVFTFFALFVGLELDLGLWLIFLYFLFHYFQSHASLDP